MKLTIDEVEEAINAELARHPDSPWLPVIGPEEHIVGMTFSEKVDFYEVFNRENHPDIYDSLRGRVILSIGGTHMRIFETLKDAVDFTKGLGSPLRIIPGPMTEDISLEELENG